MGKEFLAIFVVAFFAKGNALCSSDEIGNSDYPYRYHNWWTLYDTVVGELPKLEDRAPAECTPVHLVMVLRHGSRYPGTSFARYFDSFEELSNNLNTTKEAKLCEKDLKDIQKWTNWYDPSMKADISPTGEKEMKGIARRFTQLLPEVLSNAGSQSEKFRFVVTEIERTTQSAEAFASELFKDNPAAKVNIEIKEQLLRYYMHCQKAIMEVVENETALDECHKYMGGPLMEQVAQNFADNLGVPRDQFDIDFLNQIMVDGCPFEEVAIGRRSAWCLAFSTDDFKVGEYGGDIQSYTKRSYAHEINYEQACELRYFILSALKNASMEKNASILGHFGFTHAPTCTTLMTSMRLIEDEGVLKADEYQERADRKYKTSYLSPLSANIAFALYKCGASDDMKIQIILNENILRMPLGDPNADILWDLEEALNYYNFYDGKCDWNKVCSVNAATVISMSGIVVFAGLLLVNLLSV